MIHRHLALSGLGLTLEQVELANGTKVTCVPDLGPVEWPRDMLLRSPLDAALRSAIDHAPPGTVAADGSWIRLSFNIYLVQSPNATILIDAGIGNGKFRLDRPAWHMLKGRFLETLAALGVSPEDVDVVVNTHLHADHVGWNTVLVEDGQWRPTFANALYLTGARELEALAAHAVQADRPQALLHGAYWDSIRPIIDGPGYRTVEAGDAILGLEFIALPGHTPGMLGIILTEGPDRMVFSADAIHHPIQLKSGAAASNFCADPARSITSRQTLLDRCVSDELILAPYHFPAPAFGKVSGAGKDFFFHPVQTVR